MPSTVIDVFGNMSIEGVRNEVMNKQRDSQTLGKYLQRQREAQGLSMRRLAAAAGLNATYIMRLERGEYASPDPKHLQEIARVLEIDAADLFTAAGFRGSRDLPGFTPYLRAKYDLPPEAVAQLEAHFELLHDRYADGDGGDR